MLHYPPPPPQQEHTWQLGSALPATVDVSGATEHWLESARRARNESGSRRSVVRLVTKYRPPTFSRTQSADVPLAAIGAALPALAVRVDDAVSDDAVSAIHVAAARCRGYGGGERSPPARHRCRSRRRP